MTERKVMRRYRYEGLGLPIILQSVPMIKVRGQWTPQVDYNQVQRNALIALCYRPFPLTGDEIRFIRTYLGLTLTALGQSLGVSHVAVLNWEKAKARVARLTPTTDLCLRLLVLDRL